MSTTEQDEDLAFEQGFNSVHTEPAPAKPASPAPAPEEAQPTAETPAVAAPEKQPEPEAPAVDPFAGLPPQVRDLLAAIPTMRAELETVRRVANMVPALQSRLDKMHQQPATEQVPASRSKRDAIREDLPEIADALDELAASMPQRQEPAAPAPAPAVQADPQEEVLSSVRPSWADDLNSSDYQLWLSTQPRDVQQRANTTTKAVEILATLTAFDAHRQQTQSTRQTNQSRATSMAAGVTPQGDGRRQSRAAPEDDEDAAFAAGFNKVRKR